MTPPRYLPVPSTLPTAHTWGHFRTRLTNYAARISQAFQAQVLRTVPVTLTGPTTGTVPFEIAAHADGTPNAALVADGASLLPVTGVPAAGQWSMAVSTGLTTITFGAAPTLAWFLFLVAR